MPALVVPSAIPSVNRSSRPTRCPPTITKSPRPCHNNFTYGQEFQEEKLGKKYTYPIIKSKKRAERECSTFKCVWYLVPSAVPLLTPSIVIPSLEPSSTPSVVPSLVPSPSHIASSVSGCILLRYLDSNKKHLIIASKRSKW